MSRRRNIAAVALVLAAGATFLATRPTTVKVLPEKILPQVMFAKFRMLCPFTHANKDDFIVHRYPPGNPGASHLHRYFGNPSADWNSTLATMQATNGTCDIRLGTDNAFPEPKDKAGYWIPELYLNGIATTPKEGAVAWYSNPDACPTVEKCQGIGVMPVNYTFPQDFRMIAGVGTATSPASNPIVASRNVFWNCYNQPPGHGPDRVVGGPLNQCKTFGGNRADVWLRFPACWVGRGGDPSWIRDAGGWVLDSPSHRDHVAYPTKDGCPASHPVVLPQLTVQIPFAAINGSDITFSCGEWFCIHFDFQNAWDPPRLEQLTAPSPPV